MTTRMIGIKQFAQNLSKLLRESQEKNIHFIVMRHGEPIVNVTPTKQVITDEDLIAEGFDIEELKRDSAIALEQIKNGEVHSEEEIFEEFGITI